ncbi:MAG: hypothetical protein AAF702_04025 [Chloroflexota bacterium]
MSTQIEADVSQVSSDHGPLYSDEIDIGKWIQVIIARWREIALTSLILASVAAIAVFMRNSLTEPSYEAFATVAIARVINDITFDERYLTVSDEADVTQPTNIISRRASLLRLVSTGTIAQLVADDLSSLLDPSEMRLASLLQMVHASIVTGATERVESNLIRIKITANTAEKAQAIADSWAKHYVEHVNSLYGQVPVEVLESVDNEFITAQEGYESSQRNLESFISTNQVRSLQRQIDEKQGIINSLQAGKQTAIDTIVEEELNARRQVISAYMNTLARNRLLGFQKEQQAKTELINSYIDAEVQSRVAAIEQDRFTRESLFQQVTDAQLTATSTVLQEQVQGQINLLRQAYRNRLEIGKVLVQAELLQNQIASAGENGTATNEAALLLLKIQVASLPTEITPNPFANQGIFSDGQFQSDPVPNEQLNSRGQSILNQFGRDSQTPQIMLDISQLPIRNTEDQSADIQALVISLREVIEGLEAEIEALSTVIIDGANYDLTQLKAANLGVSATDLTIESSEEPESTSDTLTLSEASIERYFDLFEVGTLAQAEQSVVQDSALLEQIKILYPELFTLGELSSLTDDIPDDTPLAVVSLEKAQQLLQLQGLEDIPEYTTSAQPLIQAIDKLDREIQALEAQLEAERSQERQLTQQRDLAWETFKTLSNKSTELNLAQSATNSEVRLAAPAVLPIEPLPDISILFSTATAGMLGLILGILVALFSHLLGYEPFFGWSRTSANEPTESVA